MSLLGDNAVAIRFLHVLSGIVWIGMLYFFNFVNAPLIKFQLKKPYEANMAEKASGPVIVKTLFWFRWGAAFTVLFGLLLLQAEAEVKNQSVMDYLFARSYAGDALTLGIVLALIMAFNVWAIIWPRQKKILGNNKKIAGGVTDEEKAKLEAENKPLVKTATMASRVNTWFSIAMLWGMIFGAHGEGLTTMRSMQFPVALLLVLYLLMWGYSSQSKK
ncbi:MAG: hypothetical protein ACYDBQ_06530 [Thermoplasmatota archaeon]